MSRHNGQPGPTYPRDNLDTVNEWAIAVAFVSGMLALLGTLMAAGCL